ncbi:hypothetical protein SESBI_22962 [Sesbania bispinosa]|nr:hypothetical protein SESBI_22962 [Sesbania bispinosa]
MNRDIAVRESREQLRVVNAEHQGPDKVALMNENYLGDENLLAEDTGAVQQSVAHAAINGLVDDVSIGPDHLAVEDKAATLEHEAGAGGISKGNDLPRPRYVVAMPLHATGPIGSEVGARSAGDNVHVLAGPSPLVAMHLPVIGPNGNEGGARGAGAKENDQSRPRPHGNSSAHLGPKNAAGTISEVESHVQSDGSGDLQKSSSQSREHIHDTRNLKKKIGRPKKNKGPHPAKSMSGILVKGWEYLLLVMINFLLMFWKAWN